MGNLKNELFFHFNTQDWDVSQYASEKYQLTLKNEYPEIKFILSSPKDIYLSGQILQDSQIIDFNFDKQSKWLKNLKIEKYKIIELLEHLFLFMEIKRQYK